jgi:hypothetical protein
MFLKSLPVSGGFEAPSNYFETLEERLHLGLDQTELLERIPENSFEVPNEYFDNLNKSILQKIEEAKIKNTLVFKLSKLSWISGIAATAILVSFLFFGRTNIPESVNLTSELSEDDIAEQLNLSDLNEEFLCEAGWCNELEKLDKPANEIEEDILLNSDEALIIEEL